MRVAVDPCSYDLLSDVAPGYVATTLLGRTILRKKTWVVRSSSALGPVDVLACFPTFAQFPILTASHQPYFGDDGLLSAALNASKRWSQRAIILAELGRLDQARASVRTTPPSKLSDAARFALAFAATYSGAPAEAVAWLEQIEDATPFPDVPRLREALEGARR